MKIILVIASILFSFFMITSLFSQESESNNKLVYLAEFSSFKSDANPKLSQKIYLQIVTELEAKGYTVNRATGNSTVEKIRNARNDGAWFFIDGQYKKEDGKNLQIYIQTYNPETGYVIDALPYFKEYALLDGANWDLQELNSYDEKLIESISRRLTVGLLTNQQRNERRGNIDSSILSSPISELKLNLSPEESGKAVSEVFKFIGANQETITASRVKERLSDAPASISVITEEDIKKRGYTSIDEIFYDLPGFDISFANGATYINVYQRGYRPPFNQRTLIMINGIIDNHLYAQDMQLSRQYPLTNIKRIEIVNGPASATYGPNAFQGVINIITKDGKDQSKSVQGKTSIQYGQYNTYSIDGSANAKQGDFHASVSGRVFKSDEPDLSNRGGFNSNYWLGNTSVWGPLLFQKGSDGRNLGTYRDPSLNMGSFASVGYKDFKIGTILWKKMRVMVYIILVIMLNQIVIGV